MEAATLDTSGEIIALGQPHGPWTGRRHSWRDLDPFTRGYIEALFASVTFESGGEPDEGQIFEGFGCFSFLAPETLAAILKDCARTTAGRADLPRDWGANFWRNRQAGTISAFPPLTATLDDDGKVYLRAAQ